MKFIASVFLTGSLSFIGGLFLPWWSIAIAAFFCAILVPQKKPGIAFLAGFSAIFLLWAGLAWWINSSNNGILAAKIAKVLPLGGSAIALIIVTALIGALVAGLASMTGSFLRASNQP